MKGTEKKTVLYNFCQQKQAIVFYNLATSIKLKQLFTSDGVNKETNKPNSYFIW